MILKPEVDTSVTKMPTVISIDGDDVRKAANAVIDAALAATGLDGGAKKRASAAACTTALSYAPEEAKKFQFTPETKCEEITQYCADNDQGNEQLGIQCFSGDERIPTELNKYTYKKDESPLLCVCDNVTTDGPCEIAHKYNDFINNENISSTWKVAYHVATAIDIAINGDLKPKHGQHSNRGCRNRIGMIDTRPAVIAAVRVVETAVKAAINGEMNAVTDAKETAIANTQGTPYHGRIEKINVDGIGKNIDAAKKAIKQENTQDTQYCLFEVTDTRGGYNQFFNLNSGILPFSGYDLCANQNYSFVTDFMKNNPTSDNDNILVYGTEESFSSARSIYCQTRQ
ncbi:MAG: hypothetical protein OXC40_00040 [Proteobacteria bacterium]|nr:hypothetical protein [Pseudomonadota bacterium]